VVQLERGGMKQSTRKILEERLTEMVEKGTEYSLADLQLIAYLKEGSDVNSDELSQFVKEFVSKKTQKRTELKLDTLLGKVLAGKKLTKRERAELHGLALELPESTKAKVVEKYLATAELAYSKLGEILPVALESLKLQVEGHKMAASYLAAVQKGLEPVDPQKMAYMKSNLLKTSDLIKIIEFVRAGNIAPLIEQGPEDKSLDLNIKIDGLDGEDNS
jgi:hypothetical protein